MAHQILLDSPGGKWDEGLFLGNGRLGASVLGQIFEETIPLNEETIWYGGPQNRINPDGRANLEEVRALLKAGEVASAILVYQSIVGKEWDDSVGKEFYGQVYGCLGSAYGRLLLYEEAAAMYEKGFNVCQDTKMLKAYLYCCYRYLPQEQYVKMLSNEPVYLSIGSVLKEEIRKAAESVQVEATDEQLKKWKKGYQRGNI